MTRTAAIVVDGDDTLWDTQSLYDDAKSQLVDILSLYGVDRRKILETLAAIDFGNMERYGLSRRRFPISLRQTFQRMMAAAGIEDHASAERVEEIGEWVFHRTARVHADAKDFLASFVGAYRLILFTAGDEAVQKRRIGASGLAAQFDELVITPLKTRETWSALLRQHGLAAGATWSVGNSIRSDINPAVALGLRCVLVDRGSWQYDVEDMLPGPVWRVESLAEAAAVIRREDFQVEDSR